MNASVVHAAEKAAIAAHAAAAAAERAAAAAKTAGATFENSHTSDTKIAVIGLVGALVGGMLTGGAQLLAEMMKRRQALKAAKQRALGAGRILHVDFKTWWALVDTAVKSPDTDWWAAASEPSPYWDNADLQAVAIALGGIQWYRVAAALTAARNMATTRLEAIAGDTPKEDALSLPENNVSRELEALNEGCEALEQEFRLPS